jgi:hypothetical protein
MLAKQPTSAVVVHHPKAKYFSASSRGGNTAANILVA